MCTNCMACLLSSYLIGIRFSLVPFGKNYSGSQKPHSIWVLPTIHKPTAKPNDWINALKHISAAWYIPVPRSGHNGFHWLSFGITRPIILHMGIHPLKPCMAILPNTSASQLLTLAQLLIWMTGFSHETLWCSTSNRIWLGHSSACNTRQISIAKKELLLWVTGFMLNCNLIFNIQFSEDPITNSAINILALIWFYKLLARLLRRSNFQPPVRFIRCCMYLNWRRPCLLMLLCPRTLKCSCCSL